MNLKRLYNLNKYLYKQVISQEKWTASSVVAKQEHASAGYKVIAINRRRFFVKKVLNFLSQDFTKSYTPAEIAQFLDADMEKVNYALTYLTESGIIKNRDGLYGVSNSKPITFSYRRCVMTSSKVKEAPKVIARKDKTNTPKKVEANTYTLEQLIEQGLREYKEGKCTDI
jgi:hypothetical protein